MPEDRVKWSRVDQARERYGTEMVWRPYGYPEIVDPLTSAFADVDVLPRWNIPDTVFVSAAITGAFFSVRSNPRQPVTPDAITHSAIESLSGGASAAHVHVRNEAGYNVLDPNLFRQVAVGIRGAHPGAFIDGCLVPALRGEWDRMDDVLSAGILDAAPVNVTATYFGDSLFAKPPHLMIEKAAKIQRAGAKVELAVYTDADVDNARRYLLASGLVVKPYVWIILPALPGSSPMHNRRQMIDGLTRITNSIYDIDETSVIIVCAAGRASTYLTALAMVMGLHVRVGMEDSIWLWPHRDDLIESNAQHVQLATILAGALGRRVQTSDEARAMFGVIERVAGEQH